MAFTDERIFAEVPEEEAPDQSPQCKELTDEEIRSIQESQNRSDTPDPDDPDREVS